MKDSRSSVRAEGATYATRNLTLGLFTRLTSKLTKGWATANVTTLTTDDIPSGKESEPSTISSDVNT